MFIFSIQEVANLFLLVHLITDQYVLFLHMCAKSLEAAQHIVELISGDDPEIVSNFKEGVLVGGMQSNEKQLSQEDINLIKKSVTTSLPPDLLELAFSFRSLWKPVYASKGVLYRKREHVVLLHDGIENVCKVDYFFCIEVTDGKFQKFVKTIKYSNALVEDGTPSSDPHSGGLIIETSDMQVLIAPVTAILRRPCCSI